jgi:RimJ/RimL family protein N-acetyltransferase
MRTGVDRMRRDGDEVAVVCHRKGSAVPIPVQPDQIRIEPWSSDDLDLLHRLNAPEMTVYLGGPETGEQVLDRHQRYLALNANEAGHMFRIVLLPAGVAIGGVGIWESDWKGEAAWETGWGVLPEYQGRGIATIATRLVIDYVRAIGRFDGVYAFPGVDNAGSNAICRKVGFAKVGEDEFEYPKGSFMRCAIWRFPLRDSDHVRS